MARLSPLIFGLIGLTLVWVTDGDARIAPSWVQFLVFVSIQVFATVGFWMLTLKDKGPNRVGWMFCTAAVLGSVVYLLSTYANFAIEGHPSGSFTGGMAAGWIADLLFLPAIAILLPAFLAMVPDGKISASDIRSFPGFLAVSASLLYLGSAVLESHLYTHAKSRPPLTDLFPSASQPLKIVGTFLFVGALVWSLGNDHARHIDQTDERTWMRTKWYLYGALFSLIALAPYLIASAARLPHFPSAAAMTRAWGAVAACAIPLAAIPAVAGVRWRTGRMKRLLRAAAIATAVTAIHELLVKALADRLLEHPEQRIAQLNTDLIITYFLTLVIAVAVEPVARGIDIWLEDRHRHKAAPHDALDEALEDLRASRGRLSRAENRWIGWQERFLAGPTTSGRRLTGWWRIGPTEREDEVQATLRDIRKEFGEAETLARALEDHMKQLHASLASSDSEGVELQPQTAR